ncbi:probable disease resistance protein At4g33300 [Cryptomeria japonica]|uniref:probable disease resistance protein At4g33300 n=1 Tax=Cryptomeria japonica TaxID=3369 RepID=UPI0025ACF42C|nr:probable disease resistance protein At4g33300 [Cryptomeria japonica]
MEKEITKFTQHELVPTMALNQIKLLNCSQDMKDSFSTQLEILCGLIQNLSLEQEIRFNNVISKFDEQLADFAGQICEISQRDRELCPPPDMPSCLVGFDKHVMELKKFVLEDGLDVVGVTAIGGAGKSTLVTALCHHPEIQENFKERIIYIVVSESPDLLTILKTMWRNIVGGPEPHFANVEEARNKLQWQIKSRRNESILVVLDDIWKFSHLSELLFKGGQYMTIVTTRDKKIIQCIPPWFNKGHYPLPSLQEEHALSLFCCCAFAMPTIPDTHNEELVKQVQAECDGLPLALQVIGSSLNGEPDCVWEATRDALARGEISDDNQINVLLKRLETSINVLNPGKKQCFLDLAVFPKGRIIPANVLLDIWVYVRQMRRNEAILRLRNFEARNLLDLKRDPWTPESTDDCMNSYSFSQHDVMRQLALFLAEQDNKIRFRRLYMPLKQSELPPEWQTDENHSSRAQIISIHTGAMKDTQWPGMEFPEAEALVLYFSASEYCIPTFLDRMTKLKVLIIHNDNAKRTKLSGLAGFQELSQLKILHLEKLMVPPLHEDCKGLKSLQKIYLSLCEGLGKDKMFNLPALLEFNVDHCSDLEELSAGICSSKSLEILSITHCHSLVKLPDDLGKLESLKEIRLCQSPGLKGLPPSISSLGKLELLNISSCMGLRVYKSKSPELKKTLQSVAQLASLKKVICDEDNEQLFRKGSKSGLKVEAVEEEFNLNWLYWGIS